MLLHWITLHDIGITWYCVLFHFIAWYCLILHCIVWYHMYCIKSYGIAWYCIVLLLASACGLYLADTYLLCNNLFVGSLFRVWACDFPNLCSGCMMLARDTNIVYFCPPTHTMYCVFVGNTYCTHPSEPWLSTSDGQLWYPCVTSPPPRFPALWGVWEL